MQTSLGNTAGTASGTGTGTTGGASTTGISMHWHWIPWAKRDYNVTTQGNTQPIGAVVHYTAGRRGSPSALFAWAREKKFAFHLIEADGTFYQSHPLNEWGWHAGKSSWKGIDENLSKALIGIEIAAAGVIKAEKVLEPEAPLGCWRVLGRAWFDSEPRHYICREGPEGWVEAFTHEQEATLLRVLKYLKLHVPNFKAEYILGHHEISPGRKLDPGAALSVSMDKLRALLK